MITIWNQRYSRKRNKTHSSDYKSRLRYKKYRKTKLPRYPYWARLKINKKRTVLIIKEADSYDTKKHKMVPGYIIREAIHVKDKTKERKKGYEKIYPNPDPSDNDAMYLKKKSDIPKHLIIPHNKKLNMPSYLRDKSRK